MTVTVNRQSTIVSAIISKFETDTDLQSWARTFTGNSSFTFHEGDNGANVTLNEYDEINEILNMEVPQDPLHIAITYPASTPIRAGGECYDYTATFRVFGFITDSTKIYTFEFSEAIMRVLHRAYAKRPVRITSISHREVNTNLYAVMIEAAFDWHHTVEG